LNRKQLLILLAAVVATRLPFLWLGYGSDADAWRVAHSASELWHTGTYEPSRLPGYPLHEIISSPLVALGGAPLSNAGSLIACILLLIVWRQLNDSGSAHPTLLLVCLAFSPFVWKNSTATMDYLWSILAMVLSFRESLKGRSLVSGFWAGIATGFRPTNLVFLIPVTVMMILRRDRPRNVAGFLLSTIGISLVAFLPLLFTYGLSGWVSATRDATADIAFMPFERLLFFGYRTLSSIGIVASIVLSSLVLAGWKTLARLLKERDPTIVLSVAGVLTFLGLYWLYPLEREYLLPAFPFALLIVDRLASARALSLFAICIVIAGFVNPDVIVHHGRMGTPGLNFHAGFVVEDWEKRVSLLDLREDLGKLRLHERSVVMTGGDTEIWFENPSFERDTSAFWRSIGEVSVHQKDSPGTHFIQVLDSIELRRVRAAGFKVYYTAWNEEYLEKIAGYGMSGNAGAIKIEHHP